MEKRKKETRKGKTTKGNEETKTPNKTDKGTAQHPSDKKEETLKFKENISNFFHLTLCFTYLIHSNMISDSYSIV